MGIIVNSWIISKKLGVWTDFFCDWSIGLKTVKHWQSKWSTGQKAPADKSEWHLKTMSIQHVPSKRLLGPILFNPDYASPSAISNFS